VRIVICNPALPGKEKETPGNFPMLHLEMTLKNVVCVMFPHLSLRGRLFACCELPRESQNAHCYLSLLLQKDMIILVSFLCSGWRQIGLCCTAPTNKSREYFGESEKWYFILEFYWIQSRIPVNINGLNIGWNIEFFSFNTAVASAFIVVETNAAK
jgi:hypothetical protein